MASRDGISKYNHNGGINEVWAYYDSLKCDRENIEYQPTNKKGGITIICKIEMTNDSKKALAKLIKRIVDYRNTGI